MTKERIKNLCDIIQHKLGKDRQFIYLLDLLFEQGPDDTWWNVKEAYDHMQSLHPENSLPAMKCDEFAEEMAKLGFTLHVRSEDVTRRLFMIETSVINLNVWADVDQTLCHSQALAVFKSTTLDKFSMKYTQNLANSPYPYDGMLALMSMAVRDLQIISVLET